MSIRNWIMAGAIAIFMGNTVFAQEPTEKHFTVGPKVWLTDNGLAEAPLWGGIASMDITPKIWLSGMYLTGEYHDDYDHTEEQGDAEVLVGYTFDYFDVGLGFRYLTFSVALPAGWRWWTEDEIGYDESKQRNADIYGPMVYAGSSYIFGDSPFGLYGGLSWMFKDFGENDDLGFDGSHFNIEGGFSIQLQRLIATAGYRYKKYADLPPRDIDGQKFDRNTVDGFAASLRLIF